MTAQAVNERQQMFDDEMLDFITYDYMYEPEDNSTDIDCPSCSRAKLYKAPEGLICPFCYTVYQIDDNQ